MQDWLTRVGLKHRVHLTCVYMKKREIACFFKQGYVKNIK